MSKTLQKIHLSDVNMQQIYQYLCTAAIDSFAEVIYIVIKWIFHPKMKILSLTTHPHVVPDP